MYLRRLIQQRLDSDSLQLFDRLGERVAPARLREEYSALKSYLLTHHAPTYDCIAIKLTKDYRYFLTILACLEIGLPYIPMKSDYPLNRIEQIREDSNFKLLVSDDNIEALLKQRGPEKNLPAISPDMRAYIIFTSGSTGRPKGVIIERRALENFFKWLDQAFANISSTDKLLQVTEFTFDISLVDIGLFLTKGVSVHFSNFENNMFKLAYEIETNKITCLNTVPNNLNMFLSELVAERADYQSLNHLFIAGSRFSYGLYKKCQKYFKPTVNIYNLYGPTECTVYSHGKKLTFDEAQDCSEGNVSIGQSLLNLFSVIVHEGRSAKPYERGELYLGGVQLMRGYVNDEAQTKKVMVEFEGKTYYKSGDIAFQDEKGDHYIVGRTDDTIKYRGFRINLLDIDSYIHKVPYIQDVATVAIENENGDNQTVSFMILKEPHSVKEIKKDLSEVLLDFQIPEKIIFVDQFPTNISGKVDRKMLKQNYIQLQQRPSHEH